MMPTQRVQRLVERYEVTRNESCSLMDQLIKRMLAIRSWLTPVDRAGITGNFASIKCDVFAIALHGQLLEVGWESFQVLFVGKDCYSCCPEEVVIPDRQ